MKTKEEDKVKKGLIEKNNKNSIIFSNNTIQLALNTPKKERSKFKFLLKKNKASIRNLKRVLIYNYSSKKC